MKNIPLIAIALLAGCASTSVTPVSQNQIIINASAAPACGRSGASRVASKMAAVETLRRGFQRYIVVGTNSDSNVSVVSTGPTYANTYGTYNTFGSSTYGSSRTTYGGGMTMMVGTHDASLGVIMFNPGDPGFSQAIDAKAELGSDWEKLVKAGIKTCKS
ncbi:hypothetical protein [Cereibacter sphaeroides]|uniref:hypothetical protein n=1 Tax=Cereibacter sphaeroides TaxID=1063 RepID=UPI0011AE9EAF|nr:hypothetical protein [Cereibacter sphaeroides]